MHFDTLLTSIICLFFLLGQPTEIASVVGHLMEEKGKLESVVQQVNINNLK